MPFDWTTHIGQVYLTCNEYQEKFGVTSTIFSVNGYSKSIDNNCMCSCVGIYVGEWAYATVSHYLFAQARILFIIVSSAITIRLYWICCLYFFLYLSLFSWTLFCFHTFCKIVYQSNNHSARKNRTIRLHSNNSYFSDTIDLNGRRAINMPEHSFNSI